MFGFIAFFIDFYSTLWLGLNLKKHPCSFDEGMFLEPRDLEELLKSIHELLEMKGIAVAI